LGSRLARVRFYIKSLWGALRSTFEQFSWGGGSLPLHRDGLRRRHATASWTYLLRLIKLLSASLPASWSYLLRLIKLLSSSSSPTHLNTVPNALDCRSTLAHCNLPTQANPTDTHTSHHPAPRCAPRRAAGPVDGFGHRAAGPLHAAREDVAFSSCALHAHVRVFGREGLLHACFWI
jgi:hypothetical protein